MGYMSRPVISVHCGARLSPRAETGVTRLHGASPGTTRRLSRSISCRVSRNGKLSCCGMNPALKTKASTLLTGSSVICPCYCGSCRVLSGNPLHFAMGLICGPLAIGKGGGIVRGHVVSLSTNSRVGGFAVACSGLARTAPIMANVILRRPDGSCRTSATGNCVTCTSPTSPMGKRVCMTTMFPRGIGRTGTVAFSSGRGTRQNTSNRILTCDACAPNYDCACCDNTN